MEKSQSIKEIATALSKFQQEVKSIKKDAVNPFFKSKYATLDNILDEIKPLLAKNGLAFTQFPAGENELVTILMHTSGEYLEASVKMNPKDNTPQGQGGAITYMRRYALSAVLGLATDDDDDGNRATLPNGDQMTQRKPVTTPKQESLSQPQIKKIFAMLTNVGKDQDWLETKMNKPVEQFTKQEASAVIERLEKMELELQGQLPEINIK